MLDEMLNDAKRGRFQIVLVWKLDRLGRSTSHLISLLEDFKTWHVQLISFGEGLDFTSTAGKLFYTLLGAFAEFERDTIRERVRAGLRHARARGKTLGRPRKTVDAARIASLRQSGAPWRTISSEMNIPVRSARRAWQNAAS